MTQGSVEEKVEAVGKARREKAVRRRAHATWSDVLAVVQGSETRSRLADAWRAEWGGLGGQHAAWEVARLLTREEDRLEMVGTQVAQRQRARLREVRRSLE